MLMPGSEVEGGGAEVFGTVHRSGNISTEPPLLLSHFIRDYGF